MNNEHESTQLGYGPAKHDPQGLLMTQLARDALAIVLAGDHVYKMDYARMLAEHVGRGADVSIGCVEVPIVLATEYGVMALDDEFRVVDFAEKPARPKPAPGRHDVALASMGIYVFNAPF